MTLESQYKNYLKNNPDSDLTQDQWMNQVLGPMLQKALSQMGNESPETVWFDLETGEISTENED
mgnify:CR=1 FL=1|jgi:hypothetical protein